MERREEFELTENDMFNIAWRAKRLFEKEVQQKLDRQNKKKSKGIKIERTIENGSKRTTWNYRIDNR